MGNSKLANKVFIVTGGGSGIGRQLTLQLVKKGAKVIVADLTISTMQETAQLAGETMVSIHELNVSDKHAVDDFVKKISAEYTSIDGLINNAGIIQPFVDVNDLSMDTIERIMNVNFYGPLYLIKALLPHLLTRPEAYIANVSSMGGFIPFPGQTIYGASKAALKLLTEGLYAELKETNVKTFVIYPGAVRTNITENSGVEMKTMNSAENQKQAAQALPPEKAAEIILQAIEKNKFRVIVGKDSRMLDILYRTHPRWAIDFIVKQMRSMRK